MSQAPVLKSAAWDEFTRLPGANAGFKQSSWWAEFLDARGWDQFGIVYSDDDGIVGGARVLVDSFDDDKCYFYVPHGPVLPEDEADAKQVFDLFLADIEERRKDEAQVVSHLRLEPRWESLPSFVAGYHEATGWSEPRHTLCVDLSASEDEILAQMKPKGRYNIRLAQRKGVTIVEDNSPQGVSDFLRLYQQTLKRHDEGHHSIEYIDDLATILFPNERGSIFFAEHEGERLATALVIYFGDTATYKYGGSLLTHRELMAPYLLHYEIILRARALGHQQYDFYGVSRPDQPDDSWSGFSVFKRKFGGHEISFVPTMDYIYDQDAYEDYRRR